jgi:hypothetical protein
MKPDTRSVVAKDDQHKNDEGSDIITLSPCLQIPSVDT